MIRASTRQTLISYLYFWSFFKWDPELVNKVAKKKGFKKLKKPQIGYYNYTDLDDDCLIPIHHG